MRLKNLTVLVAPALLSSCSIFDYSEERTKEKMRAFERGGRPESAAERDARGSREMISAYNQNIPLGWP
jgi:hypothetical protein